MSQSHESETFDPQKARKPASTAREDWESIKFLSDPQVAAFFRQIRSVRDTALFRVIYHRGLRASEPALIDLKDWDHANGMLTIRQRKGSRGGKYRCVEIEAKAIRAWIKHRGVAPGPLFVSRNHRAIGRRQVHRLMRQYALSAGIPADLAHPHSLKHTSGTKTLELLGDLYLVKEHLGHRSIQSTEAYARVTGKTREEMADRLRDWK